MWIWVVTELVNLGDYDSLLRHGVEAAFLGPYHAGQLSLHLWWGVGLCLLSSGASSHQYPVGCRASYPKPVKGRAGRFQYAWFLLHPMVPQAMDINRDLICSRTMDPEMTLGSSSGPDVTVASVAAQVTRSVWPQRQHGPWTPTWSQVADPAPHIFIAFVGNRSHGLPLRPWLLQSHGFGAIFLMTIVSSSDQFTYFFQILLTNIA